MPEIARPLTIAPKPTSTKAQAAPGELIDRKLVAQALDHNNDGIVGRDEFTRAGLTTLDPGALDAINRGGERGGDITVEELGRALGADEIRFSGEGNVSLNGGQATFNAGRVERSAPWSFPYVRGIQTLAEVKRIAPSGWSSFNPQSPSTDYVRTDFATDRMGARIKFVEGMRLEEGEYKGDLQADGVTAYVMKRTIQYGDLADALRSKAETIRDLTNNSPDAEIKDINKELNSILWDTSRWNSMSNRDRAVVLFNSLKRFDDINVPAQPESRLTNLHNSIQGASTSVAEQARIARDIPVERARVAVSQEVDKLKSPMNPVKIFAGLGLGAAAGAIAFFAASVALPIAAAIGGAGLLVGYGIGWAINSSRAGGLQSDLETLRTINPEANKKSLQQHAVLGYKILQDARTATTLASVRAYTENADKASTTIGGLTSKVSGETRSLQTMEALVRKYAG